jgi:nicotinate-nucleotide adenylyltransferase
MESEVDIIKYKKHIGIFSGSFNPIHLGHVNIVKQIIDKQLVDEVWFVVSPCNPLKNQTELINEYIRLDMVMLAIKDLPHVKASDIEFTMPMPSYTIDTLHEFSRQYPDFQFLLIIGSDNASFFEQWKDFKEILNQYSILVYPRIGYEFESVKALYPQMQLVALPLFDISATQIRAYFAQKKDPSSWLHPAVLQYIIDNDLYQ